MEEYINSIINSSIYGPVNPARIYIYHSMYGVGLILMTLFNVLINYKVFNFSRLRAFVYSVLTFVYGYLGGMCIGYLYNAITDLKGVDASYIIRVDMIGSIVFFLFLIPTALAEKYIVKHKKPRYINGKRVPVKPVSARETLDFAVLGGVIFLSCIKIGCSISGCCFGVENDWGVFSPKIHTTVFPVQIFEFATLCLIVIATYFIQQTKFYRKGMAAPLAASMYFFARFCWEFLRYYTPEMRHFFLGLSLWQIFSAIVFIVVAAWGIGLYITQPSEPMPKNYLFANIGKKTVASKEK